MLIIAVGIIVIRALMASSLLMMRPYEHLRGRPERKRARDGGREILVFIGTCLVTTGREARNEGGTDGDCEIDCERVGEWVRKTARGRLGVANETQHAQ